MGEVLDLKHDQALLHRQRTLAHIDDPSVRKLIVMRWWECGEISPEEAEMLIRLGGLSAA